MITYAHKLPYGLQIIDDKTVKKTSQYSLFESVQQSEKVINHFINHPHSMVVPVYSYEYLGQDDRKFFTYSYSMKRLAILSDEERQIIHHCLCYRNQVTAILELGQQYYPDLIKFMNTILDNDMYYDRHPGNFLKDEVGDYKIIDLEGFLSFPVDNRRLERLLGQVTNE